MRMIEIFTSFELLRQKTSPSIESQQIIQFTKSIFSYMIDQSYYKNVRIMLNDKISDTTYDEPTTRPKTEISKVIVEMIWRPLKIVSELNDEKFNAKILSAFTQEILINDPNYTTINFIIPSLAVIKDFPYLKLISFLYEVYSSDSRYNNNFVEKSNKTLKFNGYLLNAILQFDINFLDSVINQQCMNKYLIIVGSMINCITKLPKPKECTRFSYVDDSEDSPSEEDSDNEEESPDDEMQSQCERIILLEIIKKLNEEHRVNKIVKNVDSILHLPQVIQSICIIAHNLLIYNRSAIHDGLLDLLAFKPDFIRTLWYTLLTEKNEKNQLYIAILSKGIIIGKKIKLIKISKIN